MLLEINTEEDLLRQIETDEDDDDDDEWLDSLECPVLEDVPLLDDDEILDSSYDE